MLLLEVAVKVSAGDVENLAEQNLGVCNKNAGSRETFAMFVGLGERMSLSAF